MRSQIESAARANLAQVLPIDIDPDALDLDAELESYGLTSLSKVLFLTSVCDETAVELYHFTEHDLARMRTLRHLTEALTRYSDKAA